MCDGRFEHYLRRFLTCPILSCARPIPLPSTCYAMIKAVADKKKQTNKQKTTTTKLAHSRVFLFVLFLFWFSAVPGWYQVLMSSKL